MQKDSANPYIDHNFWLDCMGEINQDINNSKSQSQSKVISLIQKNEKCDQKIDQSKQLFELMSFQDITERQRFKRSYTQILMEQQFFTSNSSSLENRNEIQIQNQKSAQFGYQKQKYSKQYIYSKNYRDKKKEQFKILQQQNMFLKRKNEQLQMHLRQKQLEISRLKHHSLQKQLTIQELNKQFLTKVTLFVEKIQKSMQTADGNKLALRKNDIEYQQLMRTYDEHGFLGSRKKQILNYYFDQILQVVLRDSQRYLCMLCCKNKDSKLQKQFPQFQKINNAFFDIMDMNQQKQTRLAKYIEFLHPVMKEIKKHCTDLYKNYKRILQSLDKVHQFMKSSYPDNIDFARKRMKLQSWFEYHKYNKIMRKLKSDWLQFIKNQKEIGEEDKKKKRICKQISNNEVRV